MAAPLEICIISDSSVMLRMTVSPGSCCSLPRSSLSISFSSREAATDAVEKGDEEVERLCWCMLQSAHTRSLSVVCSSVATASKHEQCNQTSKRTFIAVAYEEPPLQADKETVL